MKKKVLAISFIIIFAFAVVLLIVAGNRPAILPLGSDLPNIEYSDSATVKTVTADSLKNILIIFFKKECPHCEYELELLNNNTDKIKNVKLYLLTTEKDIFTSGFTNKFSALKKLPYTTFGIVNKEEYKNKFGVMVTPALYFFNKAGKLTAKLKGETKLERILKELKNEK